MCDIRPKTRSQKYNYNYRLVYIKINLFIIGSASKAEVYDYELVKQFRWCRVCSSISCFECNTLGKLGEH